jgi:hypothetical protein
MKKLVCAALAVYCLNVTAHSRDDYEYIDWNSFRVYEEIEKRPKLDVFAGHSIGFGYAQKYNQIDTLVVGEVGGAHSRWLGPKTQLYTEASVATDTFTEAKVNINHFNDKYSITRFILRKDNTDQGGFVGFGYMRRF